MSRIRTIVEPNPDGHLIEYTDFEPAAALLERMLRELYAQHWRVLVFGYCIQGSVLELQPTQVPRVSMLDGYLTADLGCGHMHLCIGEHHGSAARPTPPDIAAWRRVGRAAFFRALNRERAPVSWGLRLWNGRDEQMVTVYFPNPWLDDDAERVRSPRWERTALWEDLRRRYAAVR